MSEELDPPEERCSFCNKMESEVWVLFTAPGGSICDECVKLLYTLTKKPDDTL